MTSSPSLSDTQTQTDSIFECALFPSPNQNDFFQQEDRAMATLRSSPLLLSILTRHVSWFQIPKAAAFDPEEEELAAFQVSHVSPGGDYEKLEARYKMVVAEAREARRDHEAEVLRLTALLEQASIRRQNDELEATLLSEELFRVTADREAVRLALDILQDEVDSIKVQVANTGLDLDTSKTRCAALCQNIADQAIEHQKKCTEGTASREVLKVELDATKAESETCKADAQLEDAEVRLREDVYLLKEELAVLKNLRETQSVEALSNQIKELEHDLSVRNKKIGEAKDWVKIFLSRSAELSTCKKRSPSCGKEHREWVDHLLSTLPSWVSASSVEAQPEPEVAREADHIIDRGVAKDTHA